MRHSDRSELLEALTAGVAALVTSEAWRRYLGFQSRFHRYSFHNVLLIATQCPQASRVASFSAWRRLGRSVRKGEKAIWILAPLFKKVERDEEEHSVLRGFKWVPVFDVSQTEGEALPVICAPLDGGDPAGRYEELVAVASSLGFSVLDHRFFGAANGDCSHAERLVRIEATNAPAQRVKTLAHELAHALLHEHFSDRALAELEAESTAYVVCRRLGIDSSGYSFGYLAAWAGGGEEATAAITAAGQRIHRAAGAILAPLTDTVPA
jgi:antirestriction protein ArdC